MFLEYHQSFFVYYSICIFKHFSMFFMFDFDLQKPSLESVQSIFTFSLIASTNLFLHRQYEKNKHQKAVCKSCEYPSTALALNVLKLKT